MKKRLIIYISFVYIFLTYFVFLMSWEQIFDATKEDHIFENVGAISCFVASVFFFLTYRNDCVGNQFAFWKTKRNIFLLLIASGLFFLAGEEISWGQRIFHIQTPAAWVAMNQQGEINIHNLKALKIGHGGQGLNYAFSFAVLIYCGVIPLLKKFHVPFANYNKKINFPVPSFGFCFLAILVIVSMEGFKRLLPDNFLWRRVMVEFKESNLEFLFMMMSLWFFTATHDFNLKQRKPQ